MDKFQFLGTQHLFTLAIIFLFYFSMIFFGEKLSPKGKKITEIIIIFLLLGNETLYYLIAIVDGTFDIRTSLSLHLCGFSVFMVSYTVYTKNKNFFSLCYFWSIGALQAILTPDITKSFPSLRFVQFFSAHGTICFGVIYLIVVEKFRPTWSSLFKTVFITLILIAIVGLFNYTFDANYMFLSNKPAGKNITNFLSDKFYLPQLILVGIIFMILFYLPWAIFDKIKIAKKQI